MLAGAAGLIQIAGNMRRNALRFGDRTAYVCGATRLSWTEADRISDRVAWRLRELGIGARDHVAVFGDNSPSFVLVTYALFKLGAAAVILNAALRGPHLRGQIDHAQAKAVVAGTGLQPHIDAVRGELGPKLYLSWDARQRSSDTIDLAAALADRSAGPVFPIAEVDPQDIGCLLFSSGTTGTPKGAINTYWNLLAKNIGLGFSQEFTQSDVGLMVTPLCMGGTQLMSINPYGLLGMTGVILPQFDAGEMLRLIESERVTTSFCVPTMINAITSHPDYGKRDLGSLRKLISAGSPLPHEVYLRLKNRGIGVLECYGTSETGGGVMISADEKARNPKSVGRAMAGFEIRIVDDAGRPLPDGETGEIAIRGDPVAKGYYRQPQIEAETYRDGWFHTGDVGRRDAEGYIYLTDRKKDMIKSGGVNVFPKDVEEVLYGLAGVGECAVVGLPHAHWGEAVTAFVVPRSGEAQPEVRMLLEGLRGTLAAYQLPKAIVFVDELPKTPFGKLSKLKLREMYAGYYATTGAQSRG